MADKNYFVREDGGFNTNASPEDIQQMMGGQVTDASTANQAAKMAINAEQAQAAQDSLPMQALGALGSFNEAATGGMSDVQSSVIAKLLGNQQTGANLAEMRDQYKEAHPWQNFGSQALAYVAPSLITGGLAGAGLGAARGAVGSVLGDAAVSEGAGGLLGKFAESRLAQGIARYGTSGGALGAAGEASEGAVGRVLGEGALGRIAGGITRGATEGAIIGGLDSASQAVVHDTPLTWEHVVSGAGYGALGGGLIGGGLALGGSLVGGIGKAIGKEGGAAEKYVGKRIGLTEESDLANVVGGKSKAIEYVKGELDAKGIKISDTNEVKIAGLQEIGKEVANLKVGIAREFDALNAQKPDIFKIQQEALGAVKQLTESAGDAGNRVYETIQKDLRSRLEKGRFDSYEKMNQDVVALRDSSDVGSFYKKSAQAGVTDADIALKARAFGEYYKVVNRNLEESMAAAEKLKPELAGKTEQFIGAKQSQAMLSEAKKGLREQIKADKMSDKKPMFSVQNIIGMGVGLTTGHTGVTAAFAGGRLAGAAGIGRAIKDPIMEAAYKSQMGARIAQSSMDSSSSMRKAVSGFFSATKKAAPMMAAREVKNRINRESYKDMYDVTLHLSSQAQAQKVSQNAQQMAAMYPKMAQTSVATYTNAVQYLNAARPPTDVAGMSLVKSPKAAGLSMAEHEYFNKMSVVTNPRVVVDALTDGTLTSSHVDALKAVYPAMYDELTSNVRDNIQQAREAGKTMPYNKVIQLGILLGAPMDPTQEPDMVRAFQASYAPPPDKGGRPKGSTSQDVNEPTGYETKSEQLEK